jgi:hypothetical protein
MKKRGGGAPVGNNNAAGSHKGNAVVHYKTGMLGAIGIGKMRVGFGQHDKKTGSTMFLNGGLPKNAHLKGIYITPKKIK